MNQYILYITINLRIYMIC